MADCLIVEQNEQANRLDSWSVLYGALLQYFASTAVLIP